MAAGIPRVSVIVPAYDVASYLESCLESLAEQTLADLEVLVVDDGSTDATAEIAERVVERDGRFRLIRQRNAGLGAARNAGLDAARGELVAFVDGDDLVPRRAYEVLLGALDRTGSDFACGGVRRLTSLGTTRAQFLGQAFERERLQTHITRFPDLVVDRLACNKLLRRSFWDEKGLRFPEGVRNEDIPVMLPAHYLARSVDVVRETVYLWRRRESGDLSGSQRRTSVKGLRDRVAAVDHVSRFLAARGMPDEKLVYDRSAVGNDLRYFLDVLDTADDEFRQLFLELVNDYLDRVDRRALEQPLAIERLKWQLVRRRALPELLEVLAFQAEGLAEAVPVRRRRRWYGDYPFGRDRRLRVPRSVYRLDEELAPVVRLNGMRWHGDELHLDGYAYVDQIGAPRRDSQRLQVLARPVGAERPVLRFETAPVLRPDVTRDSEQQLVSLDWSGFSARVDAGRLKRRGRPPRGSWQLAVVLRAGGVERTCWELGRAPLHPVPAAEGSSPHGHLRAELGRSETLVVRIERRPPLVRSSALDDDVLRLAGERGSLGPDGLVLQASRSDSGATLEYPVEPGADGGDATFRAAVPVADLTSEVDAADRAALGDDRGAGIVWDVALVEREGRRARLAMNEAAPATAWTVGGLEIAVERNHAGRARIVARSPRAVVTSAEWTAAGTLALAGSLRSPAGDHELVARGRRGGESLAVPVRRDLEAARFSAELPHEIVSLAGTRPLPAGTWDLVVRARDGDGPAGALAVGHELLDRLPLATAVGRKRFALGVTGYDVPLLSVSPDLDDDEQGGFRQRRLRETVYAAGRERGLRDAVLYDCFGGREYSDNPRAVHEELVRRGAPVEHLWVVRDGAFAVPDTAVAVRELSREHHEACATARYVVANDHLPRWFARRPDQVCLQTWHGAPLKRLGLELAGRPKAIREYRRVRRQPVENWDHLVSPGPWATPVLERAFGPTARVVETGLPRTDVLLRPDRDRLAADVRRRLGLPAGKRVVLYAPTYRDHLAAGERYRLGPLLDPTALRAALPDEDVVLFRRHRLMVAGAETRRDGVVEVTAYPDANELLLVADVLVTDYSSAIFDFASTGRPIVFFTPDLEVYRDEVRGFSIDFEAVAPGPLLRRADEVVGALEDLDGVRDAYRGRYERFVADHCSLQDGNATRRVVEQVFPELSESSTRR